MEQKLLSSFCLNWHSRKLRYLYTAGAFFNLNKEEFLYIFIYWQKSFTTLFACCIHLRHSTLNKTFKDNWTSIPYT